ncbi:MAG TPA: FAD-dependent oxidoreductase [Actinopolymorphaceae bacterium]
MFDVLVIGGGFAGMWAAAAAARVRDLAGRKDVSVTLVAPGDHLVIRPRLYEENPGRMQVPLDRVLAPIGVKRLRASVTRIDTASHEVTTRDEGGRERTLAFRRLVLASGSTLRRPDLPGAELLHDVDTMEGALALEAHLNRLPEGPGRFTAVVVGASFTGLEVATELVGRLQARAAALDADPKDVRVVLVDRNHVVGESIGPGPRPTILAALDEVGVELRLGQGISAVTPTSVRLEDGTEIVAATAIWAAGMQASPLARDVPGRHDPLGRLEVDRDLRVPPVPHVFAAGDVAAAVVEPGRTAVQSCQYATQLGKHAGHNAAADLLGVPLMPFTPLPYVTCLDLGAAGAIFTTGFERTVRSSGAEGKARKRLITTQWIYPPLDDPGEILRAADPRYSRRTADSAAA